MPNLQEYIADLNNNINRLREKINSMKLSIDEVRSIDAIPKGYIGKVIPAREAVEVYYPFYIERIQGNITISSDGPFLATSIHFAYIIPYAIVDQEMMQSEYLGRWRKISSIEGVIPAVGLADRSYDQMAADFYWEYEVSESHKKRQNVPQPSSLIHQTELGNGFFPLVPYDEFPKTSTITIYATTLGRYNNDAEYYQYPGILWCGFNGYYVLEDY